MFQHSHVAAPNRATTGADLLEIQINCSRKRERRNSKSAAPIYYDRK